MSQNSREIADRILRSIEQQVIPTTGKDSDMGHYASEMADEGFEYSPRTNEELSRQINDLSVAVAELRERLAELEASASPPARGWKPDAIDWSIVHLLERVYPLTLDGLAIQSGLDMSKPLAVDTINKRCDRLAEAAMIDRESRSAASSTRQTRRFRGLKLDK